MRILHVGLAWAYWGRLEPACLDMRGRGQIAGGETAMLRSAFELAAPPRSHEVHICTFCHEGAHKGVRFHDKHRFYDLVLERGPWDALIVWCDPDDLMPLSVAGALDGTFRVCAQQLNNFRLVDAAREFVDAFVFPSRSHGDLLSAQYGIAPEKVHVIPNAVAPERFSWREPRNPFAVYSASSPDRGLHHLLEAWPEIRRLEPRASLEVFYSFDKWLDMIDKAKPQHPASSLRARLVRDAMAKASAAGGVVFHGGVSQERVIEHACRSGVLCYPCDPIGYTEGFATTVLEAWCAGCQVVTTRVDALPEVYGRKPGIQLLDVSQLHTGELAEVIVGAMKRAAHVEQETPRQERVALLADRCHENSWSNVGHAWERLLERGVESKRKELAGAVA